MLQFRAAPAVTERLPIYYTHTTGRWYRGGACILIPFFGLTAATGPQVLPVEDIVLCSQEGVALWVGLAGVLSAGGGAQIYIFNKPSNTSPSIGGRVKEKLFYPYFSYK